MTCLTPFFSTDAVPELVKALTADNDSGVRFRAASALEAIGSRDAVPALLKALTADNDSEVRGHAASALGAIGDDTVTPSLIKALEDEEKTPYLKEYHKKVYEMRVKDDAFEALYKISQRLGVRILEEREGEKGRRVEGWKGGSRANFCLSRMLPGSKKLAVDFGYFF